MMFSPRERTEPAAADGLSGRVAGRVTGRIAGVIAAALAVASAPAGAASPRDPASPAASAGAASEGAGESFWGTIPSRDEAEAIRLESSGRPVWETVVNTPYWAVAFPIELTLRGLEPAAEYVDENGAVRRVLGLFPIRIGPAYLSGGISAGGGDGFGGNVSIDVPRFVAEGKRLKFRGSAFTEGKGKATVGIDWPRSETSGVEVGAGYRADQEARFFGLGPDSDEDRKAQFREETGWGGVVYERRFGPGFAWGVGALYSSVSAIGAGETDDEPLSAGFADELAAGEDAGRPFRGYRDRSEGTTVRFELSHDDTPVNGHPWVGRPERGGLRRAKVAWFQAKGANRAEFLTWRGELQQFFPLWFSKRALGLRAVGSWIDDLGDDPVPFQRLLSNDDPDLFRGYPDDRFRDRGLAALSAEYRWPIWARTHVDDIGIDAYLFGDWGQVFEEPADVALDDVRTSWGGGLRAVAFGSFLGRLEYGRSEEGWILRLRADQIFQFANGGLYAGRDPIPDR